MNIGNLGKFFHRIARQFLFVSHDILHAQCVQVVDGAGKSRGGHIVGRSGLKLQRRTLVGGLLETHGGYHLSPALIRRQFFQPFLFSVKHANARGAIHLMTAQCKEVAVHVLYVDFQVGCTLRSIHHEGYAMGMSHGYHFLHGIHRSQHIAHMRTADQFCAL